MDASLCISEFIQPDCPGMQSALAAFMKEKIVVTSFDFPKILLTAIFWGLIWGAKKHLPAIQGAILGKKTCQQSCSRSL